MIGIRHRPPTRVQLILFVSGIAEPENLERPAPISNATKTGVIRYMNCRAIDFTTSRVTPNRSSIPVTSVTSSYPFIIRKAAACALSVVSTGVGFVRSVARDVAKSHVATTKRNARSDSRLSTDPTGAPVEGFGHEEVCEQTRAVCGRVLSWLVVRPVSTGSPNGLAPGTEYDGLPAEVRYVPRSDVT